MKRSVLFSVIFLLVLTIGAITVDASVNSTTTFNGDTPTFGSKDQEASNPKSDKDSDKNILVSSSITLQSTLTGGEQITGIQIVPETGFSTTDLNVSLKTVTPVTIANTGTPVTIEARIPQQLDAVTSTFDPKAFKVATVNFLNGVNTVGSMDVYMQRKNQLVVDNLDVVVTTISGVSDTKSLDPDDVDKLENVRPGDELEVQVKVENRYKSSANINIEDVEVEVSVTGDGVDDEDNDDIGDLAEDDNDEVSIKLEIDDDADKQTADMIINVNGVDENGALHGHVVKADVEIERDTHDIAIHGLVLTPDALTCTDEAVQLSVNVKNIGRRDEDETAISVESSSLNFRDRVSNLQLDKDDTRTKVFNIPVTKGLQAGNYAIQVQTYTDNVDLSNTEVILLESICEQKTIVESSAESLSLSDDEFNLAPAKSVSVPLTIKNTGSAAADFVASVTNTDDFLEVVSSKTASLLPGQQTTVFFNLKTRSDVETGTYSGNIVLKSNGNTIDTESFTVEVTAEGAETEESNGFSLGGNSQILWIILDVFLVILAIAFIKMIFGRKKGPKMRDIRLQ